MFSESADWLPLLGADRESVSEEELRKLRG